MPAMPSTAQKYHPDDPDKLLELVRLVCIDDTPKNTESYFIGQTFKWLKKNTSFEVIVSFADTHYGHSGVIYRATNFEFMGTTTPSKKLMVDGKEFHSRTLNQKHKRYGREIKARYDKADPNIFWVERPPKNIYVYYLSKRTKKRYLKSLSQSDNEPKNLKSNEETRRKISISNKGRVNAPESINKMKKTKTGVKQPNKNYSNATEYSFIDVDGNIYKGKNLKRFADKNGHNPGNLRMVLKGIRLSHHGLKLYKGG